MNIIWKGANAKNFAAGRLGYRPEAVVIHIMAGSLIGTDAWFNNPTSQVSAHYGIGNGGTVHQYVKETDRAFHAGVVDRPNWSLLKPGGVNPNAYTIGIEHEGGPDDVWTEAKIAASAQLVKEICARYNIPVDRQHIIGHYQIKASKPNCPATNKAIIDEIVRRAGGQGASGLDEGVRQVEEGLAKIKAGLPK